MPIAAAARAIRCKPAPSYSLVSIVIASGLGPNWTGKVSKMTDSLNAGMYSILLLAPLSLPLLWLAARRWQHETASGRPSLAVSVGGLGWRAGSGQVA